MTPKEAEDHMVRVFAHSFRDCQMGEDWVREKAQEILLPTIAAAIRALERAEGGGSVTQLGKKLWRNLEIREACAEHYMDPCCYPECGCGPDELKEIPHGAYGTPLDKLKELVVTLHERHFPLSDEWKPAETAHELILQADNMTAGLMRVSRIANDKEHKSMLARVDTLMDAKPNTPEFCELEVLADLIEHYESGLEEREGGK